MTRTTSPAARARPLGSGSPATPADSDRPRLRGALAQAGPPLLSASLVLAVWWAAALAGVPGDGLVPTPWQTLRAAHTMWADNTLGTDLRASLARAGQGFAYGASAGVAVGFLTGHRPRVAALRPR